MIAVVYMKHPETGGAAYFPDEPGVVEWHEARGWEKADEPEPTPFVPPKDDKPAAVDEEWVELTHSATGGKHQFPNNPEALEGAYDLGWELPKAEKPKKTAAKKTASAEPEKEAEELKE